MGKILGFECKLFRGEAGSTPTTLVTEVANVNLNLTKAQADVSGRGKWKYFRGGQIDVTIDLNLFYDTEDENFNAFLQAFINSTPLAILCADDNGNGIDGDFEVFDFGQPQEHDDGVKVAIVLKPVKNGADGREPAWVEGTGQ